MKPQPKMRGNWWVTLSLVALTVGYVMLFYLPGRRAMQDLTRELGRKQATIGQAEQIGRQLRQTNDRIGQAQEYVAVWRGRAAIKSGASSLFGQISSMAKGAGVMTTRFEPGQATEFEELRQLPLVLGCTGTFAQVCDLLRELESLHRLVWIEDLHLQRKQDGKTDLSCEVKLAVFTDKTQNSN